MAKLGHLAVAIVDADNPGLEVAVGDGIADPQGLGDFRLLVIGEHKHGLTFLRLGIPVPWAGVHGTVPRG